MNSELASILKVLHIAENLKKELRHSWLSNGRQESVAEHTWRMSLMAVFLAPRLKSELNLEKLLKMIIIHDLIEAEAGDVHAFETMNDEEKRKEKSDHEMQAIESLRNKLGGEMGVELFELWLEFGAKESYEAKVANAIDKLEVQIQHNEADISTWLEVEHEMSFLMDRHVEFDSALQEFKDLVEREAELKLLQAGYNVGTIKERVKVKG